ncbi:MAG: nidogen-like domain-containing protein, partial [Bacteroidota bacterium]
MKTLFFLIALSVSFAFGQNSISITQAEYQNLKQAGLIDQTASYSFSDLAFPSNIKYKGNAQKNGLCDCMIPLDSSFTLAMPPNDDFSSELINLPFTFDFYGSQYNSLYINNNGNISFISPYMTWSSNSFPDPSYNMIAPFWADVDTRGDMDSLGNLIGNGGNVWYKVTPTSLIVNWNQVGYFNMHTDLVSTFQLIITNGSDSLVSAGGNVSFCYQDMQWTTGDASSGAGGFGGIPATVGVNIGNGVNYFQVGRFDQTGMGFDGPVNNNDGVDFLDGQEIYFNVAGMTTTNTPPLLISSAICDTIDVFTGDTLHKSLNSAGFSISVLTPEVQQLIAFSVDSDAPANAFTYSINQLSDQLYLIDAEFNATGVSPGIYHINLTATDDGIPAGVTTKQFVFEV